MIWSHSIESIPVVSVILPVYNAENYLEESINSILYQDYPLIELIIVNDGSTDGSTSLLRRYAAIYNNIILVEQRNQGLSSALNTGISYATGKYIARMDADDISLTSRISSQVQYLERNHSISILGTWIRYYIDGKIVGTWRPPASPYLCKVKSLFGSPLAHPSVMFRSSFIKDNCIVYNPDFDGVEDYELWSRITTFKNTANIPMYLLLYRRGNPSSLTATHASANESKLDTFQKITASNIFKRYRPSINILAYHASLQCGIPVAKDVCTTIPYLLILFINTLNPLVMLYASYLIFVRHK